MGGGFEKIAFFGPFLQCNLHPVLHHIRSRLLISTRHRSKLITYFGGNLGRLFHFSRGWKVALFRFWPILAHFGAKIVDSAVFSLEKHQNNQFLEWYSMYHQGDAKLPRPSQAPPMSGFSRPCHEVQSHTFSRHMDDLRPHHPAFYWFYRAMLRPW